MGLFDQQFWKDLGSNARNLPADTYMKMAGFGRQLQDQASNSVDWSAGATPDRNYAEGAQDAARHTEWMAGTSAQLESAARAGGLPGYMARAVGGGGAIGIGTAMEVPGMLKAALGAGQQVIAGRPDQAGETMSEAWNSAKMDWNNNMAGAMSYSQIKDVEQRRRAIQGAALASQLMTFGKVDAAIDRPMLGGLVRRR